MQKSSDRGKMRGEDLFKLAEKLDMKITTTEELLLYRKRHEKIIEKVASLLSGKSAAISSGDFK